MDENAPWIEINDDGEENYLFNCPGCDGLHSVRYKRGSKTDPNAPCWTFDGNVDKPTFSPSLLERIVFTDPSRQTRVCHSFIRNGMIEFLSDCTHDLAGKTVPIYGNS